jgi:5'-nucleotidase (lipoprotein e(P4) family)
VTSSHRSIIAGLLSAFVCISLIGGTTLDAGAGSDPGQAEPHEQLNSVLWVQTSPEYEFACIESYRLAGLKLDEALTDLHWTAALEQVEPYEDLPAAVILDVDETVLDNSPFEARLILANRSYNQSMWDAWVGEAAAGAVPGAQEFIQHAVEVGVEVFFVTNRGSRNEEPTVGNLAHLFGPAVTADRVLTKGEQAEWKSDKTSRRAHLATTHRILLLVGDDFNDFTYLGHASPEKRLERARQYSEYWGSRWIMLPNPMYGGWEQALYGYDRGLANEEKLRRKREALDPEE